MSLASIQQKHWLGHSAQHNMHTKVLRQGLKNPAVHAHTDRPSVAMAAAATQTLERPLVMETSFRSPASMPLRIVVPTSTLLPRERPTSHTPVQKPALTLPAVGMNQASHTRASREKRLKRSSRVGASRALASEPLLASDMASPGALSLQDEIACCKLIQEAHALTQLLRSSTTADQLRYQRALKLATQAQSLLLQTYRRYITSQAKRLQYSLEAGRKASYEDMFLAGVLGLMQAARRYNVELGTSSTSTTPDAVTPPRRARFLTFAHFWIRKHMIQTIRGFDSNDVYIPQYLTDIKSKVAAAITQLQSESPGSDVTPSAQAVAQRAQVPVSHAAELMQIMTTSVVSMGASGDDGDDDGLAATWKMEPQADAHEKSLVVFGEQDLDEVDDQDERLKAILSRVLKAKELKVVCLVSGVGNGTDTRPLQLTEAAAILGVSRQAASQVYHRAMCKLKAACATDTMLCRELEEVCGGIVLRKE